MRAKIRHNHLTATLAMQQVTQHHHLEDEVITALDRVVVDLSKAKKSDTRAPPIKRERAASDGE